MLNRVGKAISSTSRTRLYLLSILFCMVVMLLSGPASQAQIYYGSITGTVTDGTGAVVSGATVTAKNVGNGTTSTATTSDMGYYTISQLQIGSYEVRIKQTGFKEFVSTGVEVHTSTNVDINAVLQLGAATETVTVEASDVQVQTVSAVAGEVVEGQQVRELPLNGENFMNLVTLSPGVSPAASFDGRDKGLTGGSNFSVNGNPYTNNLFLVDGVNNVDMGSGRTILVYPSTDAIAEFKMIRNSYGPEYGQASGAIISITTKSGENQFHGGVFYAGRNDALDANNWFSNNSPNPVKAELRRNDWGYNVSGPIIKNKLFFYWNQEWNREIRGQAATACVPTPAIKQGDFSQEVANGLAYLNTNFGTGDATNQNNASKVTNATTCGSGLPANFNYTPGSGWSATSQIPGPGSPVNYQKVGNPYALANIDPAGAQLAQFYPDPNSYTGANGVNGTQNWGSSENAATNWSEWNIRADYDINKANRVTFRWTNDSWASPAPNPNLFWGDTVFPSLQSDWSQPSKSVMAKLTTQIGNSVVNDFEFGYGHNAIITSLTPSSATYVAQFNDPTNAAYIPTAWPASLKQAGAFPYGGVWGGLQPYGSQQTMWTIAPYGNHEDLYALQDNVSKVHGNHVFKFGAYYSSNAKVEDNNGGTDRPGFGGGANTCNGVTAIQPGCGLNLNNNIANILLPGNQFNVGENSINATDFRIWHDFEFYAGDTWKIRRNVTLNYGFRWSFFREPYSQGNQQASFSLADWSSTEAGLNPSDACNGVIIVPGTDPCGAAKAQLAALGINLPLSSGTPGPNRALVNNNNHDIAPRLGIAWDVKGDGKTAVRIGGGQYFQRELIGIGRTLSQTAPFVINASEVRTIGAATALNNPQVSPNASKDPSPVTVNSWQWNVSVEREIIRNTTLQVGYVGNTGIHLTSMADYNFIPQANWIAGSFANTSSALNALRPADNFGTIGLFARGGHATYNALQALFRSRLGNYSTFQVAYTWSHSIGDVELDNSSGGLNQEAFVDPSNTRLDKGNTNINRPNILVANEVFYLPKLTNKAAYIRETVGGWELNSIITISSGNSVSIFSSGASADSVSYKCATHAAWAACAPVGGVVPDHVDISSPLVSLVGTGYNSNQRPNRDPSVACDSNQSGKQILNQNAFSIVGYTLGTLSSANASRGMCSAPNTRNIDFQLAKNWYFKEHYRIKFAMDFFNLFNHANFQGNNFEAMGWSAAGLHCNDAIGPCGLSVNQVNGAVTSNLTNNVVSAQDGGKNSGFGQANAVQPGRELQYSLRFYF